MPTGAAARFRCGWHVFDAMVHLLSDRQRVRARTPVEMALFSW
jgi:hypothetical protein